MKITPPMFAVALLVASVTTAAFATEKTAEAPGDGVRCERIFREARLHRGDTNIVRLQPIDEASWIWHPADGGGDCTVLVFERSFEVRPGEGAFTVDVSADERFLLTLDGRFVARGPHRGDVPNWQYQTYRVEAPVGRHVFRAVVTRMNRHAPFAQLSYRGGFVFKASGVFDERLTTGKASWTVGRLVGMTPLAPDDGSEKWVAGMGSQVEIAGRGPFAGTAERPAKAVVVRGPVKTVSHKCYGSREPGWMLYPSQLPDQLCVPVSPGRIVAATRDAPWRGRHVYAEAETAAPEVAAFEALRAKGAPVTVAPHTKLQLAWNLGRYHCAYPVLKTQGGKGARIAWCWAESAHEAGNGRKGDRQQIVGKYLLGFGDNFLPDGADGEFSAPWFRCGLWCRIDIETGDEPLTLTELSLVETRYPLEMESAFACDDRSTDDIRRICTRTMQMCCHEMLFDCPYYEQLMYPGDTRVQLLVLSALSRDERMIKRAIEIYSYATHEDGQCPFNYPKRGPQEGFTYTLAYLAMYGDYVQNHADREWLRARLPGLRQSMAGCELYENGDGLIERTPGWNFMDWATEWRDSAVPGSDHGHALNSFVNLFWLIDMQSAAAVERALGNELQAEYWEAKARRLKAQIVRTFWNEERSLIADTPLKRDEQGKPLPNTYSEHQQALALIADCLSPEQTARCFEHLIADPDLARTTVYFSYYLFEAYFKQGRGDLFLRRLDLWRDYLAQGVSTTLERPDSGRSGGLTSRSDCHAWGAHPIWFMQTGLAGIRSAAPFFERVRIAPSPGPLTHVRARHPHPAGWIAVDLKFDGGRASGSVDTPVPGVFVFGDQRIELKPGRTEIVPPADDPVRIVRVVYGDFELAESWIVPGGSPQKLCPIVLGFHLLEFDGRRVLVDVGCDRFGMEGRSARNFVRPVEALRRLGVEPETIEACLISHFHDDHIGAIASFPRAHVYIQEDEDRSAGRVLAGRAVTTFKSELELYGGRLKMVRVGGHTAGLSIVLVPGMADGRTAVIAGDAVYSRRNLEQRLPTPVTVNADESRAFVETYTDPRYRIYLCHD
ncbi:MAG: MBL fold metallo-hydrolase [Kiritimatiellia bacterium]